MPAQAVWLTLFFPKQHQLGGDRGPIRQPRVLQAREARGARALEETAECGLGQVGRNAAAAEREGVQPEERPQNRHRP